ncbi:unnamed protein product [Prorocentrum cordatum]|uniref:Uncharacterized protein n=1 Tax=Prorocentrum cordatum TaxID=2364126 RepID=A0ABN9U6K8_9DINO|nr:unnamed protein product [Polarella glacialis]
MFLFKKYRLAIARRPREATEAAPVLWCSQRAPEGSSERRPAGPGASAPPPPPRGSTTAMRRHSLAPNGMAGCLRRRGCDGAGDTERCSAWSSERIRSCAAATLEGQGREVEGGERE